MSAQSLWRKCTILHSGILYFLLSLSVSNDS
jgi:hypothetical protein